MNQKVLNRFLIVMSWIGRFLIAVSLLGIVFIFTIKSLLSYDEAIVPSNNSTVWSVSLLENESEFFAMCPEEITIQKVKNISMKSAGVDAYNVYYNVPFSSLNNYFSIYEDELVTYEDELVYELRIDKKKHRRVLAVNDDSISQVELIYPGHRIEAIFPNAKKDHSLYRKLFVINLITLCVVIIILHRNKNILVAIKVLYKKFLALFQKQWYVSLSFRYLIFLFCIFAVVPFQHQTMGQRESITTSTLDTEQAMYIKNTFSTSKFQLTEKDFDWTNIRLKYYPSDSPPYIYAIVDRCAYVFLSDTKIENAEINQMFEKEKNEQNKQKQNHIIIATFIAILLLYSYEYEKNEQSQKCLY